jgi:hypothetical protein
VTLLFSGRQTIGSHSDKGDNCIILQIMIESVCIAYHQSDQLFGKIMARTSYILMANYYVQSKALGWILILTH